MSGQVVARLGRLSSRRLLSQSTKPTRIRVQAIMQISTKIHLNSHYSKNAYHNTSGVLSEKCLISGNPRILIKIVSSQTLGYKRKREFHTTSKRWLIPNPGNNPDFARLKQLEDNLRDVFQTARVNRNPAEFATEECKNLIRQCHTELAVTTPFSRQINDRRRLLPNWSPESLKDATDYIASNIEAEKDSLMATDSPEVQKVEYYIKQLQEANLELQDLIFHAHVFDPEVPIIDSAFSLACHKSGYIFISKYDLDPRVHNEDTLASVIAHEMGHCLLQHQAEDGFNKRFFKSSVANSAIAIQQSCGEDLNSKHPVEYVEEIVITLANLIPSMSDKGRHEIEADEASAYFCHKTKYDPKECIKWMQQRHASEMRARHMQHGNLSKSIIYVYDTVDDVTGINEDIKQYINQIDLEMVHPSEEERAEAVKIYYAKLLKKEEPCTVS